MLVIQTSPKYLGPGVSHLSSFAHLLHTEQNRLKYQVQDFFIPFAFEVGGICTTQVGSRLPPQKVHLHVEHVERSNQLEIRQILIVISSKIALTLHGLNQSKADINIYKHHQSRSSCTTRRH